MKKRIDFNRILMSVLACIMALVLSFSVFPSFAFAQDGDEEGGGDEESGVNLDELKSELNQVEEDQAQAQAEMDSINARVAEKQEEVARINEEVDKTQEEIQRKQDEIEMQSKKIAKQQESIEAQYEGLGNRLRAMYKNGSIGFLDVLLGSASFSELMSNLEMVKLIYESDKATLEDLNEHYNRLKEALDELAEMQEKLKEEKENLLLQKDNAVSAQEELNEAWEEVHEKLVEFEEMSQYLANAIHTEQARLEAELERVRAEERAKAEAEAKRRAEEEAKRKAEEEAKRAEEKAAREAKIKELEEEATELESLIETKKTEVDEATSAVTAKQEEIDAVQGEPTDELEARQAEVQETMDRLQAELGEIQAEAEVEGFESTEEYEARLAAKEEEISIVQAELNQIQKGIDSAAPDTTALEEEKAELQAKLDALQAELSELETKLEKNKEEIESLKEEETEEENSSSITPEYTEYTGGKLGWPLNYVNITSEYGPRDPIYINGVPTPTFHTGTDFQASYGTPIYAVESGICSEKTGYGIGGGYGNAVFIYHGEGVSSAYAHMSSLVVSAGQYVSKGQLIGYVGSTGWSTGPHLHLEVWVNGSRTNPRYYLP